MDNMAKAMLGTAVGLGAAGVAMNSARMFDMQTRRRKKARKMNMLKPMVGTMVGIGMVGAAASMIK